jgi:hypothetical protein
VRRHKNVPKLMAAKFSLFEALLKLQARLQRPQLDVRLLFS